VLLIDCVVCYSSFQSTHLKYKPSRHNPLPPTFCIDDECTVPDFDIQDHSVSTDWWLNGTSQRVTVGMKTTYWDLPSNRTSSCYLLVDTLSSKEDDDEDDEDDALLGGAMECLEIVASGDTWLLDLAEHGIDIGLQATRILMHGLRRTVEDMVTFDLYMWASLFVCLIVVSVINCFCLKRARREGIVRIGHMDGSRPEFRPLLNLGETQIKDLLKKNQNISSVMVFTK